MLEKWKVAVTNLPRFWKRSILLSFDFLVLALALWLAYCLRYGIWSPPSTLDQFEVILTGPIVALPIFVRLGLYRAVIRYLPERALWTILQAMTLPMGLPDGSAIVAPLSIGLAVYPVHARSGTALLHAADAAMYGAKRQSGATWRSAEVAPPESQH